MYIQKTWSSLKAASAGAFSDPVSLVWFIVAAVVAPFTLLTIGVSESHNLPWYFWVVIALLLVGVISAGFARFARESHTADISITPVSPRKKVK